MKHTTSYKFYLKMLNEGYFEEIRNNVHDNQRLIKGINIIKLKYAIYEEKVDEFLNSGIFLTEEELSMIFHFVVFKLTDKFIKRYGESRTLKKHT